MTLPPARVAAPSAVVVIALLFVAAVINYVDRGALSVAAPSLGVEMALSPVRLGLLLSAFFWSYAVCQLGAGWLVDRVPVAWVFAAGFLLWSLATAAIAFAQGPRSIFALRLLLGAGESVAFPCFAKIVAAAFPPERRGFPNAVIDAGTKIGPAVGVFGGALLVGAYGWRAMFLIVGAAGLLWLLPWRMFGPRLGDSSARGGGLKDVGFLDILKRRDAWGTFLGTSCYLYAYFFLLTWLPKYLVDVRGLSLQALGFVGALPFLLSAAAAVVAGWTSDRWIQAGASATRTRKTMLVGGLLASTAALPAALVSGLLPCVLLLCIAYVAFGVFASNLWAVSQTLAGRAAGKWAALQNAIGAATGVVAPIVTGEIVQKTGGYVPAFAFAALAAVGGCAAYLFLVGEVAPIAWTSRPVAA